MGGPDDAAPPNPCQATWLAVWWYARLKTKMRRNLTEQTTSGCYYRMIFVLGRDNDPEWTEVKAKRTLNLKRARHCTSARTPRDPPRGGSADGRTPSTPPSRPAPNPSSTLIS